MLLHEEQTEPEHTLSSRRVTPHELAEAVAALEARKEAERAHQAETISIGDALNHLGLNTPEAEVLSEVETLRRQKAQKAQQELRARTFRRLFIGIFAACAITIISALGIMNFRLSHALKNATFPLNPLPTMPLSQVPDGRIVHCDSATLRQLAGGLVTPDKVSVDARPFTSDVAANQQFVNEWTLTKKNGQLLVTGWGSADQALVVQNNQQGFVYSNRPPWRAASNIVPVQLPAYRFANSTQGDYLESGLASDVPGVTQSLSVAPSNEAIKSLLISYIYADHNPLRTDSYGTDNFEINVEPNGVRIEGRTAKMALKQRTTSLAVEALQRVKVSMPVVNNMKAPQPKAQ